MQIIFDYNISHVCLKYPMNGIHLSASKAKDKGERRGGEENSVEENHAIPRVHKRRKVSNCLYLCTNTVCKARSHNDRQSHNHTHFCLPSVQTSSTGFRVTALSRKKIVFHHWTSCLLPHPTNHWLIKRVHHRGVLAVSFTKFYHMNVMWLCLYTGIGSSILVLLVILCTNSQKNTTHWLTHFLWHT